jgi:hypothetical protein
MKHFVKVHFSNNDYIETWINGSKETVTNYYKIGNYFNIGLGENDNLQQVTKLEILETKLTVKL